MKNLNQTQRTYMAPSFQPTELLLEQALLVTTARLLFEVDEAENVNIEAGDEPTGDMYFEF